MKGQAYKGCQADETAPCQVNEEMRKFSEAFDLALEGGVGFRLVIVRKEHNSYAKRGELTRHRKHHHMVSTAEALQIKVRGNC